jgi:hypothetical protein
LVRSPQKAGGVGVIFRHLVVPYFGALRRITRPLGRVPLLLTQLAMSDAEAPKKFTITIQFTDRRTAKPESVRAFPAGDGHYSAPLPLQNEAGANETHWVHATVSGGMVRVMGGNKQANDKFALAAVFDKTVRLNNDQAQVQYLVAKRFDIVVSVAPKVDVPKAEAPKPSGHRVRTAEEIEAFLKGGSGKKTKPASPRR